MVGSDSGNIPVLIEETRAGLAFCENDVLSLHDALRVLIKDEALRKTLGSTGAKYVRAHYDLGSVAERLSDLLEGLAL